MRQFSKLQQKLSIRLLYLCQINPINVFCTRKTAFITHNTYTCIPKQRAKTKNIQLHQIVLTHSNFELVNTFKLMNKQIQK